MRLRNTAAALVVAGVTLLPLSGVAQAQPAARDCSDFISQRAAQTAFDARPGDLAQLDADGDGDACEVHFGGTAARPGDSPAAVARAIARATDSADSADSAADSGEESAAGSGTDETDAGTGNAKVRPQRQVTEVPRGGVDTGDGAGTAVEHTGATLALAAVLGAAAGGVRRAVRRG